VKTHVLRVESGVTEFAAVFAAAREASLRVGWLELAEIAAPPESLLAATNSGALRAVAIGERSSVSVKARRGAAVLKDVVREHFMGCVLVLMQGPEGKLGGKELPLLRGTAEGGLWEVVVADRSPLQLSAAELIAALRRPRPWEG
jgi:hypothetical protein